MTVLDNRSENILVERIACGDQEAFQELFDRLVGDVFKLSYSFLLDRQMAEDATQEAFVKLWQNAEGWRPEASIKTWLFTVARNLCLDILRKKKNDLKKHQDLYKDYLVSGDYVVSGPAERKVDQQKHEKIIQNALFSLPERQREAVTLVYYMEVHNNEAARIMGMGVVAFDSLLARARRNLRDRLSGKEDVLKGCFIYGTA